MRHRIAEYLVNRQLFDFYFKISKHRTERTKQLVTEPHPKLVTVSSNPKD